MVNSRRSGRAQFTPKQVIRSRGGGGPSRPDINHQRIENLRRAIKCPATEKEQNDGRCEVDLSPHDPAIRYDCDTGEVVHWQGDFNTCLFDVKVAYIRRPVPDNR